MMKKVVQISLSETRKALSSEEVRSRFSREFVHSPIGRAGQEGLSLPVGRAGAGPGGLIWPFLCRFVANI